MRAGGGAVTQTPESTGWLGSLGLSKAFAMAWRPPVRDTVGGTARAGERASGSLMLSSKPVTVARGMYWSDETDTSTL